MSKDMLGPLTRALVGIPEKMLGLVVDVVNRLGSTDGQAFYTDLAKYVRDWKKVAEAVTKKVVTFVSLPFVTSDGRTGWQFSESLSQMGYDVGQWANNVMTVGRDAKGALIVTSDTGVIYKPVVLKGDQFTDAERITSNIRAVATEMKLVTPPWWLAPLLREAMTDEQIEALGLWWLVVMHEAVTGSGGDPDLLGLSRYDDGRRLDAYGGRPTNGWGRVDGFVFLSPQDQL